MQYGFGVGILSLVPSGSNPTPLQCGVLKDVTLDIVPGATKKLYGQYKFPVAIAEGEAAITGKATFARIFSNLYKQLLSGTQNTGQTLGALNEVGTIPGSPFAVTVTNSATWVENLSVIDATTGLELTRVSVSPATGQYSVAAGVYTFAAADTGHTVWISYTYTIAGGFTVSVVNSLMGAGQTFELVLFNQYGSKQSGVKLPAVVAPKLSTAYKNADFTEQSVDFEAYADSGGNVVYLYSSE